MLKKFGNKMPLVKILLGIFLISSFANLVYAGEHEAPAEGGEHGGGGHGEKAPDAPYSGKQTQEWSEVQTKLGALKGKVEAQEAVVKGLMPKGKTHGEGHVEGHGEAKAEGGEHGGGHEAAAPAEGGGHGGGGAAAAPMDPGAQMAQLRKEEEKLKKLKEDYEKLNAEYEMRFPEKGIKENRIYRRADPQASPSEEKVKSYEVGTQQLQDKILKQYPKSSKYLKVKKPKKNEEETPHGEHGKKESPKGDGVTEQIILKK
jgi:hypothetical protein